MRYDSPIISGRVKSKVACLRYFFKSKSEFPTNLNFILIIYILTAVGTAIHKYSLGTINNFLIFRTSFFNLIAGKDLYALNPAFHYDYYKYSPTFAFLMAPIAILPSLLGAIVWNLVNTLLLYLAINRLSLPPQKKALMLWIIFIELVVSIQNSQSNGLYTALFVLTFVFLERGKSFWAAMAVVLAAFIKIFGGGAAILFLLYPRRIKFVLYMVLWVIVLVLLPLVVVSPSHLLFLYQSWYALLFRDVTTLSGLSVMGLLRVWFGLDLSNMLVMTLGTILLVAPLLKTHLYESENFRYLFFGSLLIFITIFNHKAESPMFVIALTGVAFWYVVQPGKPLDKFLLWLTIIFTSVLTTDICPPYLKAHFLRPYLIKVAPCILIWLIIEWKLIAAKTRGQMQIGQN